MSSRSVAMRYLVLIYPVSSIRPRAVKLLKHERDDDDAGALTAAPECQPHDLQTPLVLSQSVSNWPAVYLINDDRLAFYRN